MTILLKQEHKDSIYQHAEEIYPFECCGFLIGKVVKEHYQIYDVLRAKNTRSDSAQNRYQIDPRELYEVDRSMQSHGLGVVGIYHSHPDVPCVPSEYDREHACPWYCYLIVSVVNGRSSNMKNWRLRDDMSAFDEDNLFISPVYVTEENRT